MQEYCNQFALILQLLKGTPRGQRVQYKRLNNYQYNQQVLVNTVAITFDTMATDAGQNKQY